MSMLKYIFCQSDLLSKFRYYRSNYCLSMIKEHLICCQRQIQEIKLALQWMIFAMNNLKMLFVRIVSIVFLFIKKLDAQAKLVLNTDCNMQTKNHHYQFRKLDYVIHVIFVINVFLFVWNMELSSKLELIYILWNWFCRLIFTLIYRGSTVDRSGIIIILWRLIYRP